MPRVYVPIAERTGRYICDKTISLTNISSSAPGKIPCIMLSKSFGFTEHGYKWVAECLKCGRIKEKVRAYAQVKRFK